MGRLKSRALRSKPRSFKGNQHTPSDSVERLTELGAGTGGSESSTSIPLMPIRPRPSTPALPNSSTPDTNVGDNSPLSTANSSFSKLQGNEIHIDTPDSQKITGNRIMDIEILCSVIALLGCPTCKTQNMSLYEIEKQGSARKFRLSCSCEWLHEFWSSELIADGEFDVSVSIKKVEEETMSKAAEELSEKGATDDSSVAEVAVSGDRTWQQRVYSSLNGVFVACQ